MGFCFLFVHGLLLPLLVIRAQRKLAAGAPLPPKTRLFARTLVQLVVLAAVSIVVARYEHVPLFPRYEFQPFHLALAGSVLAVAVLFMWKRWKRPVDGGSPIVQLFVSDTPLQFALWVGLCLGAGIGEEITNRGVLTTLLLRLSGHLKFAVYASAILFGLVHVVQGWRSSIVVVFFALAFQLLALATGSLYVAMAVHVVYDLLTGAMYTLRVRAKRGHEAGSAASPT